MMANPLVHLAVLSRRPAVADEPDAVFFSASRSLWLPLQGVPPSDTSAQQEARIRGRDDN